MENKTETKGAPGDGRCPVTDRRPNGVVYRCEKLAGHEHRGDLEHVARAAEYAMGPAEWRAMFEAAKPLLAWLAHNDGRAVGREISQEARRVLIRSYLAEGPGLAKGRPATPLPRRAVVG